MLEVFQRGSTYAGGAGMAYYMIVVGALLLAGGLWLTARRLAILPRAVRTRGRIESWEAQADSDHPGTFHYFPHVRFTDRRGIAHVMRVDMGYASEKWPLGHRFDVRYDPKDPTRAYAADPVTMLIGPLALAALGGVALAAGIAALR